MEDSKSNDKQALTEFLEGLDLAQLQEIKAWAERQPPARPQEPVWSPHNSLEDLAQSAGLDISGLLKASKGYKA